MRTLFAIAGILMGSVLAAAPVLAHEQHHGSTDKPLAAAGKEGPPGPRICIFSRNGLRVEPAPSGTDIAKQEPPHEADAQSPANDAQAGTLEHDVAQQQRPNDDAHAPAEQVCGTDVTPPMQPLG